MPGTERMSDGPSDDRSMTTLRPDTTTARPPLPGISLRPGFTLRRGQHAFLDRLAAGLERGERNHLGVFVPGYGKTITALAAFVVAHSLGHAKKLVVFVPRGNLRDQYADPRELGRVFRNLGAPSYTFCVADSEKVFLKNLSTDIIITTYQYASGRGGHRALKKFCESAPAMFVFDEVHHLSEDGTWAQQIEQFACSCSVALSGTPMRSDNQTLFGVPFTTGQDGQQYYVALHEVTMRDAHEEGRILKRVEAHIVDYRLKMVHTDTGEIVEMSLSQMAELARTKNDVDTFMARKRLRFHDVYLQSLLTPAFATFRRKRTEHAMESIGRTGASPRNHQMLIIAMSNKHAAAILEFVRRCFPEFSSARIGQDVAAHEREALLADYRNGSIDVMVQVDMIGEGTDIKPISVIVKADLVRALSKTLQQVFRGMRYFDGFSEAANICDIYAANDSEVVATLDWITSEEQLGIRLKQLREMEEQAARAAPTDSPWQLREVEHRNIQTHSLELFPEFVKEEPRSASAWVEEPDAVDVSAREQELRQECAFLAQQLSHVLRGAGRPTEIAFIHAEAKKLFSKAQEELSLKELARKKGWLERSINARRLLGG